MKRKCLIVAIASGLLATAVRAQNVYYTDQTSFEQAAQGTMEYFFPDADPGEEGAISSPFQDGPLSFSASELTIYSDGAYPNNATYLAASISQDECGVPSGETGVKPEIAVAPVDMVTMNITLSGSRAVAFDLGTYNGPDTISVSINGASATTVTTTDDPGGSTDGAVHGAAFFGVTSTTPITNLSLVLAEGSELDVLDFFVAVPEPSTNALIGLAAFAGVVGWSFARRPRPVAT